MTNQEITKMIEDCKMTHNGIYSDLGVLLDTVSTEDMARYFVETVMNGSDLLLRDFLSEKIVVDRINKLRYK